MTEQEVRDIIKAHGWSFLRRMRQGHAYIYVARKMHGKRREHYIGPLKSVGTWTTDTLVEKLTRSSSCSNTAPSQDSSSRGQEQRTSTTIEPNVPIKAGKAIIA